MCHFDGLLSLCPKSLSQGCMIVPFSDLQNVKTFLTDIDPLECGV